jgi:type IV pilus assembly protein PilB
MAMSLGKHMAMSNLIREDQLREAIKIQKKDNCSFGTALVKLGYMTEDQLTDYLSKQYRVQRVHLKERTIPESLAKYIPYNVAKKNRVIPVEKVGATLKIAISDPSNITVIDDLKFLTGYNVEVMVASETELIETIKSYYSQSGDGALTSTATKATTKDVASKILEAKDYVSADSDFDDSDEESPSIDVGDFDEIVGSALDNVDVVEEKEEASVLEVEAPIVKLVNGILINALKANASDIHIEPYEKSLRVRYRVDGVCYIVMNLPVKIKNAVSSRIKIMSRLDIAERRLPQDGRIKLKLGKKRDIDYRVSVLPCLFGEKIVLRLLDKGNLQLDLTKLGFDPHPLKDFQQAIESPYGMVLVTGPTGSGKTTTLYSALSTVNSPEVNIMTAEDPVEFNLTGINQVQMHDDIGLNFAAALRSFLRQDPDVIMVGEIRDFETGEIGVKAALTGHLVLSTLHTNDAPGTISRLLNMGIEPFLVASSVILILAQRLGRRICSQCKEEEENIPANTLREIGFSEEDAETVKPMKGKGCSTCGNTGYKGRIALYEVMTIKEPIKELILEGASTSEIKKKAIELGMQTLRMSGLKKVKEGTTTVSEVLRVSVAD